VVWLTEMGLDVTLRRVQAYRVYGDRTVITVSQLFPVSDVEEFAVGPVRAGQESQRRRSDGNTITRLVRSGEVADGTRLTFRTELLSPDQAGPVMAWLEEDTRRGDATWRNDRRHPLIWGADGKGYRPTPLVQQMFSASGYPLRTTRGPKWWSLPDGRSLPQAAGTAREGFDWTPLHVVLAAVPPGRWTTYGDLAELIGTAPQPTGQHIAGCEECENAWRVLGNNGRSRPSFAWSNPLDHRTQEEALTAEGVQFADGVADASQRLNADELADLAPDD